MATVVRSPLRRALSEVVLVAALALYLAVRVNANGWPKTLVRAVDAVAYERPDTAAPVRIRLQAGTVIQVQSEGSEWCGVVAMADPNGRAINVDGWMQTADLVRSPGMARFWAQDFQRATALAQEVDDAADPAIASWLQFYLGYSQWATGRLDLARATFDAVAHRRPPVRLAPHAYVAASRVAAIEGDLRGELAAYEQMLASFPEYRAAPYRLDPAVDPYPVGWERNSELTEGDPAITKRVQALRSLIAVKTRVDRALASADARAIQKATAWYDLGHAWEEKNRVDPAQTFLRGMLTDNSDARAHYQSAVAAAPGSAPAGQAAWRLIALSAPYEWEGNWQGLAEWTLENYGKFLADYPRHRLTANARFNIAVATWAQGGYPEVYNYVFAPDRDTLNKRQESLDQWFDTNGFGGGLRALVTQHPEEAAKAQKMFRDLVATFPSTPSAAMAQYYVAVIFDYCLGQPDKALPEYQTFIRRYPKTDPFVKKSRRRIAAIIGAQPARPPA